MPVAPRLEDVDRWADLIMISELTTRRSPEPSLAVTITVQLPHFDVMYNG